MALPSSKVVPENSSTEGAPNLVTLARSVEQSLEDLRHAVDQARSELQTRIASLQLVSREEAARLLDMSQSQLDRLTKSGRLPVVWIDSRPRYRLDQLREFVDARTIAADRNWKRPKPQNKKSMNQDPCFVWEGDEP